MNLKYIKQIARNESLKITLYQWLIIGLLIIGIISVSATTITSNRIADVKGVPIDLTNKITSYSSSNCVFNSGSPSDLIDNNINTYLNVSSNGNYCQLDFNFDKNYSFTDIHINQSVLTSTNANYITKAMIINQYDNAISTALGWNYLSGFQLPAGYVSLATGDMNTASIIRFELHYLTAITRYGNIYEIKIYGIDEDI